MMMEDAKTLVATETSIEKTVDLEDTVAATVAVTVAEEEDSRRETISIVIMMTEKIE